MRGVHESLSDGHSRGCAREDGHKHWQRRLHPLSALRCELSGGSAENKFQKVIVSQLCPRPNKRLELTEWSGSNPGKWEQSKS